MRKTTLASLLAFFGTLIVFAGQTGPDQALANIGSWLEVTGLGGATRWAWSSSLAGWITTAGLALIGAAGIIWWRRRKERQLPPPEATVCLSPPPQSASNPLLSQIDSLIDRFERANQAYARDPDRFHKLPKYEKLWVQIDELDDLAAAVKLAIRREHGAGSPEDQLACSTIERVGGRQASSVDDYFRRQIDWLRRVRNVAALLGS